MTKNNYFISENRQIIVTLGPSTLDIPNLKKIEDKKVDFVRINLSHTHENDIEKSVLSVINTIKTPLIMDTEGSQIRTGYLESESITLNPWEEIKLYNKPIKCSENSLYLRPEEVIENLEIGDLIFIDFDNVIVRVDDTTPFEKERYVKCTVITGGQVGNNKAVTVENQKFRLPALSRKDLKAIEIAKQYNIKLINLSFVDSMEDVLKLKEVYPQAVIISKIETRSGVDNLNDILKHSDAILIDRGDLSREVPFERISFAQKIIINRAKKKKIPVFVATNLLDSMIKSLKPSRAEVNDIVNTLLDGADGLVLAAETAIGSNPIETINFMKTLCIETENVEKSGLLKHLKDKNPMKEIDNQNYITSPVIGCSLIPPHGGRLINRTLEIKSHKKYLEKLRRLGVDEETAMDAEQIAIGSFSPLEGFLNEDDFYSVLNSMRLMNGCIWTIPIAIQLEKNDADKLEIGEEIVLVMKETNEEIAVMQIESKYKIDKIEVVRKWFGTKSLEHPGVKNVMSKGNYVVGGRINLINRIMRRYKYHELTPAQTRKIFESMGWTTVLGFHTRNVIHRSHEYIQLKGIQIGNCDGLFVHPVIGKKKKGDFETGVIIETYEQMVKSHYPKNRVIMGTFATFSRYAGPREALFTAICRQNFGCSHFVVGRDHTGIGLFYEPDASQKIFDSFEDIEIKPIKFDKVFYCCECKEYVQENDCKHDPKYHLEISGTQIREMLKKGVVPPEWTVRKEISDIILERKKRECQIFVE